MQYQLNIDISSKGLSNIYDSGQTVTLVKSVVTDPLSGGNLPVAWLAFQPLQSNQVTWMVTYYMYATTTVIQSGATIKMTSKTDTPVQAGWTYPFAQGQFGSVSGTGSTYNVENQSAQGKYQFGLAQQALVNNVQTIAPLNAVPVLYNESATFTPKENISIFLSGATDNGSVISQVSSKALAVTLTSQNPVANIGFNDTTNTFYLVGQSLQSPAEFAKRLVTSSHEPRILPASAGAPGLVTANGNGHQLTR
ncbi:hypothetical protein [Pendulispora albinea]|uniref:Uncharacterized protein n=1 Tax=Pendulispora albinea TaxID=2741071 RepID=A0ABZ2LU19_9BACT